LYKVLIIKIILMLYNKVMFNISNKRLGFTLIELLIVMAILSILTSIIIPKLSDGRVKARDTVRISHMDMIRKAIMMYAIDNGNFIETGSGCGASGIGIGQFDAPYGGTSIRSCLENGGYLPVGINDPKVGTNGGTNGSYYYMKINCGGGIYILANLEKFDGPAPDNLSCSNYDTSYGMDYILKVN
jgi:prepilin-type N-terminal cleavage/methylation domain-containing protein